MPVFRPIFLCLALSLTMSLLLAPPCLAGIGSGSSESTLVDTVDPVIN